jgi:D-alanine-D-alanine ligase
VAEDDDPDRSPVVAALRRWEHKVVPIACTLDLAAVRRRIQQLRPDVVFNRVESLGGSDALVASLLVLLDTMRIPYTGCPTEPYLATTSKIAVKERLANAGIPTPKWVMIDRRAEFGFDRCFGNAKSEIRNPRFILKSIYEHASFAMDDTAVIRASDYDEVVASLRDCESRFGRPYFAEEYIDGREFNLALWGDGPDVLPPAEIDFSSFPADKPRIVGQRAKFVEGSFEFENTPRRYDFSPADRSLIQRLRELAIASWRLFGLTGYARVDFRCDAAGQPWILEINANPCLAPESGLAAAWAKAGIEYHEGIQRIVLDAIERAGRKLHWSRQEVFHEHALTF